jgi:tyrosyl-tRNA synthetase
MVKAGFSVKVLMADWFLQRHYKIGTDLKKIRTIGYYNIEMWKAAGMDLGRVQLVWLSDELNHHSVDYWPLAVEVSRKYTMNIMAGYLLVYIIHYLMRIALVIMLACSWHFQIIHPSCNKHYCLLSRFCWNKAPYGPQRLPAAEIFYPCMQVAAILCQKVGLYQYGSVLYLFNKEHHYFCFVFVCALRSICLWLIKTH